MAFDLLKDEKIIEYLNKTKWWFFWIILGIPFFIPAIILYIAYVNYALLITNKRVIKRK
jgi:hypothetical protein